MSFAPGTENSVIAPGLNQRMRTTAETPRVDSVKWQRQSAIDARRSRADRNRWIALYVLCVGMLMIVLDVTVVNVALPSIQNDLGFSQSSLAWVVNAYLIAFGGLLLLAGRFGDILGRKNVFMAGLGALHRRLAGLRRWRRARRCWSAPASSRASAGR